MKTITAKTVRKHLSDIYNDAKQFVDDDFWVYDEVEFKNEPCNEFEMTFCFADGKAITTDGKYFMKYPKMAEIEANEDLADEICEYCGLPYNEPLYYRDSALCFGKVYKIVGNLNWKPIMKKSTAI